MHDARIKPNSRLLTSEKFTRFAIVMAGSKSEVFPASHNIITASKKVALSNHRVIGASWVCLGIKSLAAMQIKTLQAIPLLGKKTARSAICMFFFAKKIPIFEFGKKFNTNIWKAFLSN
jgi:hypothetical protein